MEKPSFIAGSEKRFFDFISTLNDKDKIGLISHTDLDGLAAAKIVNEVIQPDFIEFVDYAGLNSTLVQKIKKWKAKKLILTDIAINSDDFIKEIEKFAELLIIDHHLFPKDFNSDKTIFINAHGFCATYICYYLLSKIQNLEHLDWLVACASLSDFMLNNQNWLEDVYRKYNIEEKIDPIADEGKINSLKYKLDLGIAYWKTKGNLKKAFDLIGKNFGEINELESNALEVDEEIKSLIKRFEKEKQEINGKIIWIFGPKFDIGSKMCNILSKKDEKKTFIFLRHNEKYYFVSARRQDRKENMVELLQKLVLGFEDSSAGGHIPAAGGHFLKKDLEKFKENLKRL